MYNAAFSGEEVDVHFMLDYLHLLDTLLGTKCPYKNWVDGFHKMLKTCQLHSHTVNLQFCYTVHPKDIGLFLDSDLVVAKLLVLSCWM